VHSSNNVSSFTGIPHTFLIIKDVKNILIIPS
jgi:hypothetical protein